MENRKSVQKINETKSWFFEKINKIDKSLVWLTKKKRERAQITNIRNQRGNITTDPMDIKGITKQWTIYASKFDNLHKMDKFQDRHNLPKLTPEEIDNLNRCISIKEFEPIINNLPK